MVKHGDIDLAAFTDARDLFGRFEDASGRDKVALMGVFGDPGVVWRACGLAFAASAPAQCFAVSFLIHGVLSPSLFGACGKGGRSRRKSRTESVQSILRPARVVESRRRGLF